jgi:hypothetical protein
MPLVSTVTTDREMTMGILNRCAINIFVPIPFAGEWGRGKVHLDHISRNR